jgi:hypothetical protein
MENKFIKLPISGRRIKKSEIVYYNKDGIRLYYRLKHRADSIYINYSTEEDIQADLKKFDEIYFDSERKGLDEPIRKILSQFFIDIYSDVRNDGKLLGTDDILEKLNKSEKVNDNVQKIKELFYGKTD